MSQLMRQLMRACVQVELALGRDEIAVIVWERTTDTSVKTEIEHA